MAKRIKEKQEKFRDILATMHNDFLGPINEAMKLFLVQYPQIESVSFTTCGGEYNDSGYSGFGLRGPFYRIQKNETLSYVDSNGATIVRKPENEAPWDHDDLSGWSSMWGFNDELIDSVTHYLDSAPYMLMEHGDDALLIWTTDMFRVSNVVHDSWDAYR